MARLAEHGYQSICVSTVPEAFDALRSDKFVFAITSRPDIDILRNIRAIPVINLEVFFHAGISNDGMAIGAKRFDSKAFIERIDFLARSAPPERQNSGAARLIFSKEQESRSVRWWATAVNALRISQNRKGRIDVQS
ncbi:hypothetical protein RMR21_023205 (plasmid) [Agrobacterium sp. rho-8.1]